MASKYKMAVALENSCFRRRVFDLSRSFLEVFYSRSSTSWLELNLKRNNKATFYDSSGFLAVPLTNVLGTQGQLLS